MATDLVMVPQGHFAAAAGCHNTRRLFLCAVLVAMAAAGPLAAPAAAPAIAVSEAGGVYRVTASFAVAQPAAIVVGVLTDFERIPEFMPDVRSSNVLERSAAGTIVEQSAVARFMMFSKRVHLVLEVTEEDGTIKFRDRCGKSFASYEGAWVVSEQDTLTVVDYQLTARPSFDVPGFVLKRLLKRDAGQLIDRLTVEIARRADRGQ